FYSSRRRHTRFSRDWSSDVCSSDLEAGDAFQREVPQLPQVVLAAPGRTGLALVLDRDAVEADPAEQPLHEAVPLTQLAQRGQGADRKTSCRERAERSAECGSVL